MEKPSTYKPMSILKTMVFLKNFMKIDNYDFKNFRIKNYKAKFVTDYEAGFASGYKIYDTYEEARKAKSYRPIYICFEVEIDDRPY